MDKKEQTLYSIEDVFIWKLNCASIPVGSSTRWCSNLVNCEKNILKGRDKG